MKLLGLHNKFAKAHVGLMEEAFCRKKPWWCWRLFPDTRRVLTVTAFPNLPHQTIQAVKLYIWSCVWWQNSAMYTGIKNYDSSSYSVNWMQRVWSLKKKDKKKKDFSALSDCMILIFPNWYAGMVTSQHSVLLLSHSISQRIPPLSNHHYAVKSSLNTLLSLWHHHSIIKSSTNTFTHHCKVITQLSSN